MQRVCPRWRCAALNPPDAVVCVECGKVLIPRRLGDLSAEASPALDDNDDWDRRKRLEEEEVRRQHA